MTKLEERQRRLLDASLAAAERFRQAIRKQGQPLDPAPGDLFLLPETEHLPVTWALIERDPGQPGRLLLVPADTSPILGPADVATPVDDPNGLLTLRCAFPVRIDPVRLIGAIPAGTLEPSTVKAAKEKLAAGAQDGSPASPAPARTSASDPDYESWTQEVISDARALLLPEAPASPPVLREPAGHERPPRQSRAASWAVAATVVLALGLGFALIQQHGQVASLRQERDRALADQRAEAQGHSRRLAKSLSAATRLAESYRTQIAELAQRGTPSSEVGALTNLPLVWLLPEERVRGAARPVRWVGEASHLIVVLEVPRAPAFEQYQVEVRRWPGRERVWLGRGLVKRDLTGLPLVLPRRLLAAGDYEVALGGMAEAQPVPVARYQLSVGSEHAP